MDRYRILRNIASGWIVISVLCLTLCGCGEQSPEPPPKPREVRKKIVARPGPPKTDPSVAADLSSGDKPPEGKSDPPEPGKTVLAQVSATEGKDTKEPSKESHPAQAGTAGDKDTKPAAEPEKAVPVQPSSADKAEVESRAGEAEKADAAEPADSAEKGGEDGILSAISGMDPEDADKFTASYDPKGRVDPFEPLLREKSKKPEKEQPETAVASSKPKPPPRRLTPLEKLDLGQLKLVGIIRAESGNKALVEEASGKGYIIVKGTYIGIHSGIVVDILPDRVVVEEQDEDVLGKVTVRKRELKFNRPEGEDYYEM